MPLTDKPSRILLIEDESAIADTVVYALSTEGFHVDHRATGGDGLRTLQQTEYDLVILDVGLPDGSGFEVCRELRRKSSVPVVFLTARGEEIDRVLGLELGADDFVTKPFSPRELAARVKAILRRAGRATTPADAPSPEPPRGLPFRVDDKKMSITYFDKPLTLSRYEFRLLKTLVERPGWVFSRDQLMEAAWDDPAMSLDRTVDAHINSLRAKLREIRADVEAIKTHRGTGYSLKEDW